MKTGFSKKELKSITDYMFDFYGEDKGIYKEFFGNRLTRGIIREYLEEFVSLYNRVSIKNGYEEMDSFDSPHREFYRDWILHTLFHKPFKELEYGHLIKEMRDMQRSDYKTLGELTFKS
ncbi:MAG TPA: hypothetical protein PK122_02305 [Candidatus Paceibacterota bacterium]|nr:hypothetical protein [Candidatus Paceibacterota bacterium]HPI82040.1 hypothetical protein [Candidatus Paceibacterota bacterium]